MNYKEFGKTGKKVAVIGFGGMRFPTSGEAKKYDFDYCANMIHEANRLGINYFDTAPFYNDDQSENIFGHAFKNMPDDFYVSTKCSARNGADMRSSLERSLKRLNVEKINFFHIWCVMDMEDYHERMAPGGPYDELLKAKQEGLVDHICISTHCTGDEIAQIANERKFEGITLGYNIINYKYRQAGIKAAYDNNIAVITMNPLGGGLITSNPEKFAYIKETESSNVLESAIKFNASHKEINVVLTGMDSLEHVRQNASYGNVIDGFADATKNRINEFSNPKFDTLCTGCRYCEPCPVGIPISKFMLAHNKMMLSDVSSMKSAIRMHWRIPPELVTNCTKCGLCETKCTQHLPIISRLERIDQSYN